MTMLAQRFVLLYSSLFVPMVESGQLRGQFQLGHDESSSKEGGGSIDIRCIDNPSSVECQRNQPLNTPSSMMSALTRLEDFSSGLFHRKKILIEENPYWDSSSSSPSSSEPMVSSAPTRDMCYGNMERLAYKKYCHSEMPSVSLEPSLAPSLIPDPTTDEIKNSPSPAPVVSTAVPSPTISRTPGSDDTPRIPSAALGMCQGDCDSPTDCANGLYCHQRIRSEQTPGCPGTEFDGSRTDYCTNVTLTSVQPPIGDDDDDDDVFRLKLYWNESYWWQESNVEMEWCVACPSHHVEDDNEIPQSTTTITTASHRCHSGEDLFLQDCSSWGSVVFFTFPPLVDPHATEEGGSAETVQIQIADSDLCLERSSSSTAVAVATCSATTPQQHWVKTTYIINDNDDDDDVERPFELSPTTDPQLCLTIHHHPKHGETLELFPCNKSRRDTSSLWTHF
jgi:hypothetical protein